MGGQLRRLRGRGTGGGNGEVGGGLEGPLEPGPRDEGVLQRLPGGPPRPGVRVLQGALCLTFLGAERVECLG